jgi:hypothetical protein
MTALTAKTYDRQTATFLAMVGQNMPEISGDVMQGWIENQKALQKALRTALCPPETTDTATEFTNLIVAERPKREFATWKTVKLGTHKTVKDLTKGLTDAGFRIGDYAAQFLTKITIASAETEIELVNVSGAELGFTKKYPTRAEIYARATTEFGLDLVPNEVGPQLRLQYPDQPLREWMLVSMEPLSNSVGDLSVFLVGHYGVGRWLGTGNGNPGRVWSPVDRWVFARRKQNQFSDAQTVEIV